MQVKPGDCYLVKYKNDAQVFFIIKSLLRHEKCTINVCTIQKTLCFYPSYWLNIPVIIQSNHRKLHKL